MWAWNAVGAQKLIVGWLELHFHAPAETKNSLDTNKWNSSFSDGSVGKEFTCHVGDPGDTGSIPWLGRFPWGRKWQPNAVFLPEKSHGRGTCQAIVQRIPAKQLSTEAFIDYLSFLPSLLPFSLFLSLSLLPLLYLSLSFLRGLPLNQLITLLQTTLLSLRVWANLSALCKRLIPFYDIFRNIAQ